MLLKLWRWRWNRKRKKVKNKLEEELKLKKGHLGILKFDHNLQTVSIVKKMRELETFLFLDNINEKHEMDVKQLEMDIAMSNSQLQQLNHVSEKPGPPGVEKEFECPVFVWR